MSGKDSKKQDDDGKKATPINQRPYDESVDHLVDLTTRDFEVHQANPRETVRKPRFTWGYVIIQDVGLSQYLLEPASKKWLEKIWRDQGLTLVIEPAPLKEGEDYRKKARVSFSLDESHQAAIQARRSYREMNRITNLARSIGMAGQLDNMMNQERETYLRERLGATAMMGQADLHTVLEYLKTEEGVHGVLRLKPLTEEAKAAFSAGYKLGKASAKEGPLKGTPDPYENPTPGTSTGGATTGKAKRQAGAAQDEPLAKAPRKEDPQMTGKDIKEFFNTDEELMARTQSDTDSSEEED